MEYVTKKHITLWILTIVISLHLLSCRTSQDFINFHEVKQGFKLEKAQEIEIDTLLTIWIENTHNPKIDINLNELYKDSTYTYFGKRTSKN